MTKKETNVAITAIILLGVVIGILIWRYVISVGDALQIVILFFLALATLGYMNRTRDMATEMREQRIAVTRPYVIQKVVPHGKYISEKDKSDDFEIYNAGNGAAIELEIFLLDNKKKCLELRKEPPFLHAGETVGFIPTTGNLISHAGHNCYLMCRYQSVISEVEPQIWYETWLSFEPVKSQTGDKVYLKSGELKFQEVSEKVSY